MRLKRENCTRLEWWYFGFKAWARIPENGIVTADYRGWGALRWLYLWPMLLLRWAARGFDWTYCPINVFRWR